MSQQQQQQIKMCCDFKTDFPEHFCDCETDAALIPDEQKCIVILKNHVYDNKYDHFNEECHFCICTENLNNYLNNEGDIVKACEECHLEFLCENGEFEEYTENQEKEYKRILKDLNIENYFNDMEEAEKQAVKDRAARRATDENRDKENEEIKKRREIFEATEEESEDECPVDGCFEEGKCDNKKCFYAEKYYAEHKEEYESEDEEEVKEYIPTEYEKKYIKLFQKDEGEDDDNDDFRPCSRETCWNFCSHT
tara:strand:- start:399 stop:1154 length:756 start_codon:yes stop_codon:yes gene_type:complete